MSFVLSILFGGFAWLKKAATALFSLIVRYPLHAGLIAALVVCALLWRANSHNKARYANEHAAFVKYADDVAKAQIEAAALFAKQKRDLEKHFKDIATQKDREYETELVHANDATERFIAANRVRRCPAGPSGATTPASSDRDSGISSSASQEAVMVEADDIRICTTNTIKLEKAVEWAAHLNDAP